MYNVYISETIRAITQKCVEAICRFLHVPSNVVIAKIALRDLDLLLEVKNVKFLYH